LNPTKHRPWILDSTCSRAEASPFHTVHCWLYSTHCSTSTPCPYWIPHSLTLAGSMMEELRRYLTTAPGGNMPPSSRLQQIGNGLPDDLLNTAACELSSEGTTAQLWDSCLFPLIRYAVKEVDQNPTRPALVVRRTLYNQISDTRICPSSGSSPRLHREDESWAVFDVYTPEILALAQRVETAAWDVLGVENQ
jgi:hypothetical protein